MTAILPVLFIIGFTMGGFILGWCICRDRFNKIERGLDALGNSILLAERDRRAEAERYSANHQARYDAGPTETAPPPHPTGLTMDEMFDIYLRGNKKEEPKPATKPESKREHKRRIQLNE
jgi:hypothetical protein